MTLSARWSQLNTRSSKPKTALPQGPWPVGTGIWKLYILILGRATAVTSYPSRPIGEAVGKKKKQRVA